MSTSRVAPPPVNLKERIAALQQRTTSPPAPLTAQPTGGKGNAPSAPGSLKDKIAKFEERGGTPVPRGSFGFGAPPVNDGSVKKRGELYGNRIPSASRLAAQYTGLTAQYTGVSTQYTGTLSPQATGRGGLPEADGRADVQRQRPISAFGFDVSYHTGEVPPVPDLPSLYQGQGVVAADDVSPSLLHSPPAQVPVQQETVPDSDTANDSLLEREPSPVLDERTQHSPSDEARAPDADLVPESKAEVTDTSNLDDVPASTEPAKELAIPESPQDKDSPSTPPAATQSSTQAVYSSTSAEAEDVTDMHTVSSPDDTTPVASPRQASLPSEPAPASPEPDLDAKSTRTMSIISANNAQIITATAHPTARAVVVPAPIVVPPPSTDVQVDEPSPLPEKREAPVPRSFRAVVHKKVREDVRMLDKSKKSPQAARVLQSAGEPPASPGSSELASLLMSAALLEEQLSGGVLPSPDVRVTPVDAEADEFGAKTLTPVQEAFDPFVTAPRSLSQHSHASSSSSSSHSHQTLTPTPDSVAFPAHPSHSQEEFPPTPPPKSARTRYFSRSLRSLRSVSISRHSVSMSSEESAPVVTPPSEEKAAGWGSPKKTMGRATSFVAERIWSRKRTKSGVVDPNDEEAPEIPALHVRSASYNPHAHGDAPPSEADSTRPVSWANTSSSSSSPYNDTFDSELFDAFPQVPDSIPLQSNGHLQPPPSSPPQHEKEKMSFLNRATTLPSRAHRSSNDKTRRSMETQTQGQGPPRASIIRRKHY